MSGEQELDAARRRAARWKATARRYRSMLAIHRDRDMPRIDALTADLARAQAEAAALREAAEVFDAAYEFVVRFGADQRVQGLRADVTRARATLERTKKPGALGSAILAERDALREAGDAMADCIEYFWKPSPCEHGAEQCGPCETTRWGLLQESLERYRALAARRRAEGGGDRV